MNSITRKITHQNRYLFLNNINIYRKISSNISEAIIINENNKNNPLIKLLLQRQLHIKKIYCNTSNDNNLIWISYNDKMQLDCTSFNTNIIDYNNESNSNIIKNWIDDINKRKEIFSYFNSNTNNINNNTNNINSEVIYLQKELDISVSIVHRASFLSRYLQHILIKNNIINEVSFDKDDKSPVTIADFAVQALIIEKLSIEFPNDYFIAEESSKILRNNEAIRNRVLQSLSLITGKIWINQLLYNIIDKGSHNTNNNNNNKRMWILDPIDGTKGFMRGEHYCIALGLLINNIPMLSVLGCPNLQLNNVLNKNNIEFIIEPSCINMNDNNNNTNDNILDLFSPTSGSIYYAVTGQGAYARSLSMKPNDSIQVHVSNKSTISDISLTESKETSHGSRDLTHEIRKLLKLNNEYIRIDGQCKHCIVGSGAVEGNLRLPKAGYIENVFDHMPGCHFIKEAGGHVTDLIGNEIDYSLGKFLSSNVTGIISSNKILHNILIETIAKAKINIEY